MKKYNISSLMLVFLMTGCSTANSQQESTSIIESINTSIEKEESSTMSKEESQTSSSSIEESQTISSIVEESSSSSISYEYEDLFVEKIAKPNPTENDPHITIEKDTFEPNGAIEVSSFNCGSKDWIGLYPYGGYPQDMPALTWEYANNGKITLNAATYQEETKYDIYLCKNDGYVLLDQKSITIQKSIGEDYGVKEARYVYEDEEMWVSITPSTNKELTYELYWAKDGKRLDDYTYFAKFKKASESKFAMQVGQNLFMPNEANQIEIYVVNGKSKSVFVDADDGAKIHSKYLYGFNVYSDLHVRTFEDKPNHVEHLQSALNDAYCYNRDSKGLFIVGDMTDRGYDEDYQTVCGLINIYKEKSNVPVYYTMGNHEYICVDNFTKQVGLYEKYANVDDLFYTVEMEGSTCVMLSSDSNVGEGTMSSAHIQWLREQLDKANKEKPIFVFVHQPLINSTAGSYENQNWYGFPNEGKQIKEILAEYENTFLFAGHTHWEFESKNNIQINLGATTYINLASVGYLWNDNDAGEPGSEGVFVEVYEDCLVVKGREFTKNKWDGYALYRIPFVK